MKNALLALMLAGANNHECFAEDQSPLLKAQLSLKQAEDLCTQEGHEFRLLGTPIVTADQGGTPEAEVIFDYGALVCEGNNWFYRGSMGAAVDIYTAEDTITFLSNNGYELFPFQGHLAVRSQMHKDFSSDKCRTDCFRYIVLTDGTLMESFRR